MTRPPAPPANRRLTLATWSHWLAALIFALGAIVSVGAGWRIHAQLAHEASQDFGRQVDILEHEFIERVERIQLPLRSVAALHATSDHISRAEFRKYWEVLGTEQDFSIVRGLGIIERVPRRALPGFVERQRRDGAPNFTVRTTGEAQDLFVIRLLEPVESNRAALGLDIGSEAVRRAGAEAAIRSGKLTITGVITLLQDEQRRPGFLLLLPYYEGGYTPASIEERQARHLGFAYTPIVADEFVTPLLELAQDQLDFNVYLGSHAEERRLVYANLPADNHAPGGTYNASRTLLVADQVFTLRARSTPAFDASHSGRTGWLIGLIGLVASALLAVLVQVLATARQRAESKAEEMSSDLERLAMVTRHTNDAVIITDPQGCTTWVNDAFTRVSGYTPQDILGRKPGQLLQCPQTDPATVAKMADHLRQQKPCRVQLLNRHKNGDLYWLDLEIQPMRDKDGVLTGFMAVERDITTLQQAQQAAQAHAEDLEAALRETDALMNTINVHAIVSEAGPDGRIMRVNDAFCRISGYSADELLGQDHNIVNSGVHPRAFWQDLWTTITASRPWRGQVCNRAKDGTLYWVDSIIAPFLDAQGRIEKYVSIRFDITKSHAAEAALSLERLRLKSILEGTDVGTWEWNVQTGETVFNERWASLLGYRLDELQPTSIETWLRFTHPDDLQRSHELLEQHFNGTLGYYECEVRMRHRDGHWIWVLDRGKVFERDAQGGAVWMAGTHMDISRPKQLQQALQESQDMLERAGQVAGIGGWSLDLQTQALSWATQTYRIYGLPLDQLPTLDIAYSVFPPQARAELSACVERLTEQDQPYDIEVPMTTLTGRQIWVRAIGEVERVNGQPVRLFGSFQEVTERYELRRRIEAQNAQLHAIIENLPLGLSVIDADLNLALYNQPFKSLLELPDALFATTPVTFERIIQHNAESGEYGDVDVVHTVQSLVERARHPVPHMFERTRPNGRTLEVRGVPMPGGGFLTTYTDITERRLAEREARRADEILREAINALDQAFVIYDENDRLLICNERYREIYPVSAPMMKPGNTFEEILRYGAERGEYPEAMGRLEEWLAQRVAAHRALRADFNQELPGGRHLRIVERRTGSGYTVGFRFDISDLVQARATAEQASREAQEALTRLRAVYDVLPVGLTITDREGQIIDCNPASERLLGISRQEHLARTNTGEAWVIRREDGSPMPAEEFASVVALSERRTVHNQIMEVVTPERDVWLSVSAMPMANAELGAVVAYVDVTEARRQNQALLLAKQTAEQASQAKSQFLANMSHEIRTPMNAILGMLSLLQTTELSTRQEDYTDKAASAARSLLALLNDILDFSKVEAGKLTLEAAPLPIDQLMRDLAVILSATAAGKPVEVVFQIDPRLPNTLVGDALRLKQVLINLAGNAIKFTAQGYVLLGIRVVALESQHATLEFSVQDTGIGIARDSLQKIFEGFSQAEASTTRRFGGTGLGLAISARMVNMMGGHLEVDSELGQGSRFHFRITLPVATDARPVISAPSNERLRGLQVLVVDDNAVAREATQGMLASMGWQVEACASGEEALALVRQRQAAGLSAHDAYFIDWQMPGLDGWQTAQEIERVLAVPPGGRRPLVVMVTAQGRETLARRPAGSSLQLSGFLVKPVTASMLLDAVAEARLGVAAVPRRTASGPGQQRRLRGLHVLLVEDNKVNQQVAQELLQREGAQVTVAEDGALAVKALARNPQGWQVVLMDVQMPVMDGYTATRKIRQELKLDELPIIAMTANAMASDRADALASGMDAHVGKPFNLDELVATILEYTGAPPIDAETQLSDDAAASERAAALDDAAAAASSAIRNTAELDLTGALQRLGGDTAVLTSVLQTYARDLEGQPDTLAGMLAQGQADEARRLLHTLKGSSATVGAQKLAALAAQGEQRLRQPALPDPTEALALVAQLRQAVQAVTADLTQVLQALRPAQAEPAPAATLDRAALAAALQQLLPLLRASDLQSLAVFAELQAQHEAALQQALDPLAEAMSALDFDQAAAQCEQLLTRYTG